MSTRSTRPVSATFGRLEFLGETEFVNSNQTLAELIKSVQELNDWSDRDLGRRAERLGLDITTSNFSRLKNRDLVSVKGSLIRTLAKVLKVSEGRVAQAAMASMGVYLEVPSDSVDDAVRTSDEFSERDRRVIISVLDALRDTRVEAHDDHQDSPKKNPPGKRTLRAVSSSGEALKGQKIPHPDDPDFETPPPLEQLAAHPYFKTEHEKFEEAHGERGEENQDPDDR